jgi:hypothetical protein
MIVDHLPREDWRPRVEAQAIQEISFSQSDQLFSFLFSVLAGFFSLHHGPGTPLPGFFKIGN